MVAVRPWHLLVLVVLVALAVLVAWVVVRMSRSAAGPPGRPGRAGASGCWSTPRPAGATGWTRPPARRRGSTRPRPLPAETITRSATSAPISPAPEGPIIDVTDGSDA